MVGQSWDAERYATTGRFVATMATPVLELLAPQAGEQILDVGCGDGALTEQVQAAGATLVGVDASETMVRAARARGLDARHESVLEMQFGGEFDAVFSNAALHWVPCQEQAQALERIASALRPGGRFVAEMGGQGNIAAIRTALQAVLEPLGIDAEAEAASCFPAPAEQRARLEGAGFTVERIELIPRPTPLPGGTEGMHRWLETFRNGVLDRLPPGERERAVTDVVRLLRPVLSEASGGWTADYVRLRFVATRG